MLMLNIFSDSKEGIIGENILEELFNETSITALYILKYDDNTTFFFNISTFIQLKLIGGIKLHSDK